MRPHCRRELSPTVSRASRRVISFSERGFRTRNDAEAYCVEIEVDPADRGLESARKDCCVVKPRCIDASIDATVYNCFVFFSEFNDTSCRRCGNDNNDNNTNNVPFGHRRCSIAQFKIQPCSVDLQRDRSEKRVSYVATTLISITLIFAERVSYVAMVKDIRKQRHASR